MRPTNTPARVVLQLRRAVVLGHFGLRVPAGPAGWVNHSIFSTTPYSTNQATPCGITRVLLLLICNIDAISPHNAHSSRAVCHGLAISRPVYFARTKSHVRYRLCV